MDRKRRDVSPSPTDSDDLPIFHRAKSIRSRSGKEFPIWWHLLNYPFSCFFSAKFVRDPSTGTFCACLVVESFSLRNELDASSRSGTPEAAGGFPDHVGRDFLLNEELPVDCETFVHFVLWVPH